MDQIVTLTSISRPMKIFVSNEPHLDFYRRHAKELLTLGWTAMAVCSASVSGLTMPRSTVGP